MPVALTIDEYSAIQAVRTAQNVRVSSAAATLAVVLITREYARPELELVDMVRQYPGLDEPGAAERAIAELRSLGWLDNSESYGRYFIHQAPDLRDKLAVAVGDATISDRLLALRSTLEHHVRIVGPMKERRVFETYLELLGTAQQEICLPMLATSPRIDSVPIIQARARIGVRVRILLGSPEIVARLRGEPMAALARDAIDGWKRHASNIPSMEVRISDRVEDMLISTSMIIDGRLLRTDVYDPMRQRSLEGVMIEVESSTAYKLNLVSLVQQYFDDAWDRARPTGRFAKAGRLIIRGWQWWLCLAFSILTVIFTVSSTAGAIFGSIAATFFVNGLVASIPYMRRIARNLRP